MKMTKEGLALIKAHEGCKLTAYKCPADVWTIGYGHTSAAGLPNVKRGLRITRQQADALLVDDLKKYEAMVKRNVKVELTDNQFSALVSFTYNVGEGALKQSSLLKAVNSKKFGLVPSRFALWNKGGGHVLAELVRRRADEAALFMSEAAKAPELAKIKVVQSQGKNPLLSAVNGTSLVGAAAATGAAREVAENTTGTVSAFGMDTKTLVYILCAVVVAGLIFIAYDRFKKSREYGV